MDIEQPQKKSSSFWKGCLITGGVGCLVMLIAFGAMSYVGYRFFKKQYGAVMEKFEAQGYKRVEGQIINVTDRLKDPTLYLAQTVKIQDGSERGIAMLCQTAELSGEIKGNVYFMGQMLTIHEGTVIEQDLEVTAQVVNQFGTVNGSIKGVYQVMNEDAANPVSPDAAK